MQRVDDPADPRVADYVSLTDVALRRRLEPAEGLFIAEGVQVVERALRASYRLRSALVSSKAVDLLRPLLAGADVPVFVADPDVIRLVAGFHVHRGVLASFARKPLLSVDQVLSSARRVVVLEDTNNPTNLGAVARSAAALGMDALLLSPECADPLYRRAVRVSMGEVFALRYARVDVWPEGLAALRDHGFRLLALTPDPQAAPIGAVELGDRVAVLLGAEGPGLSAGAMARCDERVRIPMAPGVDSLNVAAAAAIAFHVVGRGEEPRHE
ncbi:MAG TPA: RNA methyltransferase [Mycobacteriales bacterium]|nr:RNA methyltransferase [Mycobacteriales bacterium]